MLEQTLGGIAARQQQVGRFACKRANRRIVVSGGHAVCADGMPSNPCTR